MSADRWVRATTRARTIAGASTVGQAEAVSLVAIFIVAFAIVVLAVALLRYIGSRRPTDDPAAEAIAMAEADRRREAARRPTGGTGMWQ